MGKIVYIVICCCNNGDEYYHIDSTWTNEKKAKKRCDELNSKRFDWLQKYGWGFYGVELSTISN